MNASQNALFSLAIVVALLLGSTPVNAATCPCWPVVATSSACNATQTAVKVSTYSSAFKSSISLIQCMPLPAYDASSGYLQVGVCWRRSCYTASNSLYATGAFSLNLTLGSASVNSMPGGKYYATSTLPLRIGSNSVNLVVSSTAKNGTDIPGFTSKSDASKTTNTSYITVPTAGLRWLNLTFTVPDTTDLDTGFASVRLRAGNAMGAPPPPPAVAVPYPCPPNATQDSQTQAYQCEGNKVPMRLWNAVGVTTSTADAAQKNEERLRVPANFTRTPDAVFCVDPPAIEAFTFTMTYELTWNISCWWRPEGATPTITAPLVFAVDGYGGGDIDRIPAAEDEWNAYHMAFKWSLEYNGNAPARVENALTGIQPSFAMGPRNTKKYNYNFTGAIRESAMYALPVGGLQNFSFYITVNDLNYAAGRARFWVGFEAVNDVKQGGNMTLPDDVYDLKKDRLQVTWNSTFLIRNYFPPYVLESAMSTVLGRGSEVQWLGYQVHVPIYLRDSSVLFDCSQASQDDFLQALRDLAPGLPPEWFTATCTRVIPDWASAYPQDKATAATPLVGSARHRRLMDMPDTTSYCLDTRMVFVPALRYQMSDSARNTSAAALTELQDIFAQLLQYVLAGYDTNTYCTSPSYTHTYYSASSSLTGDQDYVEAQVQAACASDITDYTTLMSEVFGEEVAVLSLVSCTSASVCEDCWPYSIPVYQIVFMVCGALLLVVALAAVRMAYLRYKDSKKPVGHGVMADDAAIKELMLAKVAPQQQTEEEEA